MAKIKIKLTSPITIDKEVIHELEIRDRLTVGDLLEGEKAGGGQFQQDVATLARCAGLVSEDLYDLSAADYATCWEALKPSKKAPAEVSATLKS